MARGRVRSFIPAGLKPFLQFHRLDQTSLVAVRRALVNDELFRDRLGLVAAVDMVDHLGLEWLQRAEGWQDRVLELHRAVLDRAREAVNETALRKSERRREAAEQVAARVQAELLSARLDVTREQAQRAKAETAATSAVAGAEGLRREVEQLRRELDKSRARELAATTRADLAAANAAQSAEQVRELEQRRDALLSDRAAQSSLPDDDAVKRVEPRRERGSTAKRIPIAIPGGIYGDSVAGATHLLRTPRVLVIVDGYNVAKLGWPNVELVRQRECCIELLEDLGRRFGSDIRVIFDGADVIGASSGRRLIRVQYSPAGVIADDVIRSEVAALPLTTPVVVVTNDQAIRSDVRSVGVNIVSSDMLLAIGGRAVGRA